MADLSARHLGIPALFIFLAGSFIQQQPAPGSAPASVPASAPAPVTPLARYTVVQQVEFSLGVADADHAPDLALCPDGTLYAGIRGGGLKAFDAAGKLLLTDSTIPLSRYPETYACDSQRHLYTAERKLSIYELTADGKMKQDSSSSMRAVQSSKSAKATCFCLHLDLITSQTTCPFVLPSYRLLIGQHVIFRGATIPAAAG